MSRQRLEAMLEAFARRQWELLTVDEYSGASTDPFKIEEGEIVWALRRSGGEVVELRFWATGPRGESTLDLRDIMYCCLAGDPDLCLYLTKSNLYEWQQELQEFVWKVEASSQAS